METELIYLTMMGYCFLCTGLIMVLVKLSYARSIPDVLTTRDIDIFVDINTSAQAQQTTDFHTQHSRST